MLIVGLTGSIGMGKSTIAKHLASRGVPVIESDAIVHALYSGRAAPLIEAEFPGAVFEGSVDREKLSAALSRSPDSFEKLEAIVHPLVREAQWEFIYAQQKAGAELCVLDIPLLFETGGERLVDHVLLVSAPEDIQAERVLARPGMTWDKFATIRARQMPDAEKRARADSVIDTGLPLDETLGIVDKWLESSKNRPGEKFGLWRSAYGDNAQGRS
ncbi:MAG: dephospho-CoA kinase [Hyphomicrobiales bacterium]|nr:dephospho-CoA kinase [Hyphomicrobiales bacterium]